MLDLTTAFKTFPVLETPRLRLRAITLTDAEAILRIMSDMEVVRYFGQLPMRSHSQAVQRVERIQAAFRERTGIRWAITYRDNGEFLGSCGFWRIEHEHERGEIGYELARAWWGRGVMTEAVGAALGFGFQTMGFHSVEAHIHPANGGSRRVLEKLGFVQEGYFHENYYDPVEATFTDTAIFSFLRATWMRQATAS